MLGTIRYAYINAFEKVVMNNLRRVAFVAGFLPLLLMAAPYVYAQSMPNEVSGRYVNDESGVEITFPDPFTGFEISGPFGTLVTTSLEGLSEPDSQLMTSITLVIAEKTDQDPTDPSSFTNEEMDCNPPSVRSVSVAGVQGSEVTVDCPSTSQKFRMVAVETGTNWIVVMYMSPSSEFESNVGAFNSALGSLKVQGAVNSEVPDGGPTDEEPASSMIPVTVDGEPVQVSVASSSVISEVALDEASMTLSFQADGSGQETEVSVGSVLEGPYVVMVDGQVTQDFEESTDSNGVKVLTVSHGSGAHDVSISGTQVVPEFPVAALGGIVASLGAISLIGRTRLFRR